MARESTFLVARITMYAHIYHSKLSTIYRGIVIQMIRATTHQSIWQRLQDKLVVFKPDV